VIEFGAILSAVTALPAISSLLTAPSLISAESTGGDSGLEAGVKVNLSGVTAPSLIVRLSIALSAIFSFVTDLVAILPVFTSNGFNDIIQIPFFVSAHTGVQFV
jgi:hypothetical protein